MLVENDSQSNGIIRREYAKRLPALSPFAETQIETVRLQVSGAGEAKRGRFAYSRLKTRADLYEASQDRRVDEQAIDFSAEALL
jgi:hypothetical protein